MISIPVGNGNAAREILVGDLAQALDRIAALADGQPLPLVTDPRVLALHGAKLAPIALQPPILSAFVDRAVPRAALESFVRSL